MVTGIWACWEKPSNCRTKIFFSTGDWGIQVVNAALMLPSGIYSTAPAGASLPKSRRKNGVSRPAGAGGSVKRSQRVPRKFNGRPALKGENLL